MSRKIMFMILFIFLLGSVLVACSNDNSSSNETNEPDETTQQPVNTSNDKEDEVNSDTDKPQEKLDISFMIRSYGEGLVEDSPLWAHLEEKFNIEMNVTWVPSGEYGDTLNVRAAGNNLPDIYEVPGNQFKEWVGLGAFVDMKPFLDTGNYPNLEQYISQEAWEFLNPPGKIYGAPYFSYVTRDILGIRKDWLENLNLEIPTTTEEFFDVAYAFAHDDPDQNGQNDTVGFATAGLFDSYYNSYIAGAFGLANGWKEENGKLIPRVAQVEETKDFIAYYKRMYDEGVMDRDFSIITGNSQLTERFLAGITGIVSLNPNNYTTTIVEPLQEAFPGAEVVAIAPPIGPTGLSSVPTNGTPSGKRVINANTTDEAKQERIMQLLDYLLSDEGYDLIRHGIEGIHWEKTSDGGYKKLDAWDTDHVNTLLSWFFRRFDPNIQLLKWDSQERLDTVSGMFEMAAEHAWPNAGNGLISQTEVDKGDDLTTQLEQELMKIIVGDEPLDHVEEAINEWRANGGDQIIQEINEAYQASK